MVSFIDQCSIYDNINWYLLILWSCNVAATSQVIFWLWVVRIGLRVTLCSTAFKLASFSVNRIVRAAAVRWTSLQQSSYRGCIVPVSWPYLIYPFPKHSKLEESNIPAPLLLGWSVSCPLRFLKRLCFSVAPFHLPNSEEMSSLKNYFINIFIIWCNIGDIVCDHGLTVIFIG